MLRRLRISNFALIEEVVLEPPAGFVALTGETGAGKSVLLDSLQFLLGARASADMLRTGASRALVEAEFDLPPGRAMRWLEERGLDDPDSPQQLLLRRELLDTGRSRAAINGRLMPAGDLAELGSLLVEFHAQGTQFALLDAATFEDFFDEFAGALPQREAMADAHARLQQARAELARAEQAEREAAQRIDFLEFQVRELETLQIRDGELEELEAEQGRLAHVADLQQAAAEITALVQGDPNPGALGLLGQAQARLEDMADHDPSLEALVTRLTGAIAEAEDVAREVERYAGRLEADPQRLEQVADRIAALRRALRRHGPSEREALARLESLRAELEQWRRVTDRTRELPAAVAAAEATAREAAAALRSRREAAAPVLDQRLAELLRLLALPTAQVRLHLEPRDAPAPRGSENVELLFSANAGESPRPLRKVASGGELSRVMLALRALAAAHSGAPVLVLDEVDAGLSGAAAACVGAVLADLGRTRQVLCVTHSATVAAAASAHFRVLKREEDGRTRTEVLPLDADGRRNELARILDGRGPTATSLALAEELLRAAPGSGAPGRR